MVPWYQTNLFWGFASTGFAIVLVVIAKVKRDLRKWLIFAASLFFFAAIGVVIYSVVRRPVKDAAVRRVSSANTNTQNKLPETAQTVPSRKSAQPTSRQNSSNKRTAQVQRNKGSNSTNVQIGEAQGPVNVAPSGIANSAPNYGVQIVNTPPLPNVSPPTQVFNSPDPYVGRSDFTVAQWIAQETGALGSLGTQCIDNETIALQRRNQGLQATPGFLGVEGVQVEFWNEFRQHIDAITKLHDSINYRLGPADTASFNQ